IMVCDDDINFIKYMKKMLLKSGLLEKEVVFCEYTSGEDLINSLEVCEKVDLLILDIKMKKIDGHKTARIFRKQFPSAVIVFCSGAYLPTVESFEVVPFRYLLKEYGEEKMIKELKIIVQEIRKKIIEPVVMGTYNYNVVKLKLEEILYISIARNGSNIYVNPKIIKYEFENHITSKKKLPELYMVLKNYGFEYAHNSYIVNLDHIKRKTIKELELSDGTVLSIARSKEKELRVAFAKYKAQKY
ncbi:MAG: response regulator, partial [Lachnospiraceae bacterium]|nr:response regulator [Lachnospiraceae bacterium]